VDIEDKAAIAVIDADKMAMVGKYDLSSRLGLRGASAGCEERDSVLCVPRQEDMVILSAPMGTSSPICRLGWDAMV